MKQSQTNIGSLRKREVTQPQQNTEYYLFNSQDNLKAYSDDIMGFAYYGYNAANTRTYKLSLYNTNLWINGQQQPLTMQLQQAMFYPNTYLNFDAFGNYTKHYYNGMERIASRLGDNTTTIAINNNILEDRRLQVEDLFKEDIQELISEPTQVDMPPMLDILNLQPIGTPNDIYYYHPNHLGSTSFVTDQNQTITQGFLYAPFGEITTEYNVNFGNNTIPKYSFNAKELDEETGFYYYEARYYAPPTFTSRDPLFEKYFWMTPYAYCANNPVKYVDPTGCENVIYIIDLQQGKNKAIDTERLRNNVNAILQNRGLETRMEFLPEGVTADNFDPNKLDATDSYVVLGSYEQIKKFAEKKDEHLLNAMKQENFTGGANNPEVSVNGRFNCVTPERGIAIDAQGAKDFAKSKKMNPIYFASLAVLHGAGHNAGFNHSAADPYYESPSRYGQDMENCAIMASGKIVDINGINVNYMEKSRNSLYIKRMKQLFGTKKSSVNYKK